MGRVLQGIGKGSMFGNSRFLGVHNPFGSALGKANDPFINDHTLVRLTRHPNEKVRNTAIASISARMKEGKIDNWISLASLLDHPSKSLRIASLAFLLTHYDEAQKILASPNDSIWKQCNASPVDIICRHNLSIDPRFISALKMPEISDELLSKGLALVSQAFDASYRVQKMAFDILLAHNVPIHMAKLTVKALELTIADPILYWIP